MSVKYSWLRERVSTRRCRAGATALARHLLQDLVRGHSLWPLEAAHLQLFEVPAPFRGRSRRLEDLGRRTQLGYLQGVAWPSVDLLVEDSGYDDEGDRGRHAKQGFSPTGRPGATSAD
jgi:hypothetical protein